MNFPSPPPSHEPATRDLAGLLRVARQEHGLSTNTILAYQRTWRRLFAATGAHQLDPATLTTEGAARLYSQIVNDDRHTAAGSQRQARAALAYAYAHWGQPDPFARTELPDNSSPPPAPYLGADDLASLLHHLSQQQSTYSESLAYHLATALFHTCTRYSEVARLRWSDYLPGGPHGTATLNIRATERGGTVIKLPVDAVFTARLDEWRNLQQQYRGMKMFAAQGLRFCRSEYVFAGPGGEPFTNQSFNAHLKKACQELRLPLVLTAHGLRHSVARILLHDQHKNLRELQRTLRHRDIRTTARYVRAAVEPEPADS